VLWSKKRSTFSDAGRLRSNAAKHQDCSDEDGHRKSESDEITLHVWNPCLSFLRRNNFHGEFSLLCSEDRLRDHAVNALGAVHHLGDMIIHRCSVAQSDPERS
jgi:hypothetical protein